MWLWVLVPPTATPVQSSFPSRRFLREGAVELCLISILQLTQVFSQDSWVQGILLCQPHSPCNGQTGSHWLCYPFPCSRCPSLLGCMDRLCCSPLFPKSSRGQGCSPISSEENHSPGRCSSKRREKLQLISYSKFITTALCIVVSATAPTPPSSVREVFKQELTA